MNRYRAKPRISRRRAARIGLLILGAAIFTFWPLAAVFFA